MTGPKVRYVFFERFRLILPSFCGLKKRTFFKNFECYHEPAILLPKNWNQFTDFFLNELGMLEVFRLPREAAQQSTGTP